MADNIGKSREPYVKQETVYVLLYGCVNFLMPSSYPQKCAGDDNGCTEKKMPPVMRNQPSN